MVLVQYMVKITKSTLHYTWPVSALLHVCRPLHGCARTTCVKSFKREIRCPLEHCTVPRTERTEVVRTEEYSTCSSTCDKKPCKSSTLALPFHLNPVGNLRFVKSCTILHLLQLRHGNPALCLPVSPLLSLPVTFNQSHFALRIFYPRFL